MPEEEEEQEIENRMKENFPNLAKERDIQARKHRVPNNLGPKRTIPRYTIIKMPKVKDKENFERSKRKAESYLQRSSHKTIS